MAARPDRPPYNPGDLLAGKYSLRRIVGEGGMAVVYSALDTSCQRKVALKILRPAIAARRPLSADLVKRGAATAVQLHARTPHVVEVLTAGITDDAHHLPYYVMERLHGATLRTFIDDRRALGRPFEILEITDLATQIATALVEAHDLGIVHRDIKPENVYLAEQRDHATMVKLLDFGISALAYDEPGAPGTRTFSGSRRYASPEQLDGRPATPVSDVYSLGLVLYEMLTFTLPHDRHNPALSVAQTALNVLQVPLAPPRKLREDVPDRLDFLILNCLEHPPDMRPTALQVARKLRAVKQVFEHDLLGSDEAYSTDVSGPPAAVMRRGDDTSGDTGARGPQRFGAARPVDLLGSTQLGVPAAAKGPVDHEVFFENPVDVGAGDRDRTDPMPETLAALGPAATLPLPTAVVVPPPKPDSTLRLPTLQAQAPAAPSPPVVIPPWTPVIAPSSLVESRRGVRPAAMWTLLAACVVAMVAIAVATGILPRRRATRGPESSVAVPIRPPASALSALTR